MYKITKDGAPMGMTEAPNYVRRAQNGCFVLCPAEEAQGIALEGRVYHLLGTPEIEGAETVMLEEMDGGAELWANTVTLEDADAINVDHEYRLTMLELGLADSEI